jgi:PAS domain S-box-containing protein
VAGIAQDITFRKQAEVALRESEERFRQIFADAPIGMALVSTDGQFRQINKALCEMLGYTESELTTLTFRDITYAADLEKELPYVEQCLKGEISKYQLEKRYVKKNGELLLINLTSRVIRDPVSKERYGLAMIEDITQRKELEKMKDEFISVASHELRTPLTSLRASLGLLSTGRLGVLSEQGQRLLGFAVTDTDRLVRLVNDILDLERLRFRKMTLIRQICDAAELLQRVVGIMQPIAQKAGVTLSIVPVSLSVWADCDRIIQVLTNLLSNAIKFSPQGSTICLSAEQQGNQILFQVKDQGRGIPVEQLEIIFEPFKQVDASDSRQKGGTGLGLAICRSIIQQHGGLIWVQSTLGQGSTFCFTLPMPLEE